MVLRDNMEVLKEIAPDVWQKVSELESALDKELVRSVTNNKSMVTLQIREKYIHDLNNPVQEAVSLIEQFKNIDNHSDVLFYGVGLGYHIKAFIERYPDKPFAMYEPVPEVFFQFLRHSELKQFSLHLLKSLYMETGPEDPDGFWLHMAKKIRSSILIIDLPIYQSIFPEKRQAFFAQFEKHLKERSISLATLATFEKRWTINSLKNFIQLLNSPNILLEARYSFKNKPAILVAPGPSLENELENLREIKQNGLAYIFSVGTAINALVKRGVYPHAACTYDPSDENQIVCKEVLDRGLKSIPLIFGSTVGYETLEKYPGPKMHMLINQDSLAAYYLKSQSGGRLEFISDAATIAVITLQLLCRLGFNPIILVGLNLAYLDGKNYTAGSTYPFHEANPLELKSAIPVRDVYGNEVPSNYSYIRMRLQLENYLSCYREVKVINTTRNGAYIEGTSFQTLDEVLRNYLRDRGLVNDDWQVFSNRSYDLDFLMEQNRVMNCASTQIARLMDKCKQDLDNIGEMAKSGDPVSIERSYDIFNFSMENLRNNQFFTTCIMPMSRVELERLILAVPEISGERNPLRKAQMMESHFRPYLTICEQDFKSIIPLFQELNNSLLRHHQVIKLKEKAALIKVLLLDVDGVLTDGAIYYSTSGEELRKFNYKDRAGIHRLRDKGIETLLVNPEVNPGLKHAAKKLGIKATVSGDKEELITKVLMKYMLESAKIACIFNDLGYVELFKRVGLSFTVKNASTDLQREADYVLPVNGGHGAVWEIAELLS